MNKAVALCDNYAINKIEVIAKLYSKLLGLPGPTHGIERWLPEIDKKNLLKFGITIKLILEITGMMVFSRSCPLINH